MKQTTVVRFVFQFTLSISLTLSLRLSPPTLLFRNKHHSLPSPRIGHKLNHSPTQGVGKVFVKVVLVPFDTTNMFAIANNRSSNIHPHHRILLCIKRGDGVVVAGCSGKVDLSLGHHLVIERPVLSNSSFVQTVFT